MTQFPFLMPVLICLSAFGEFAGNRLFVFEAPKFEKDILSVFTAKCGKCPGDKARDANLDLRLMAAKKRGRNSGPAVPQSNGIKSPPCDRIESGDMAPEGQPR